MNSLEYIIDTLFVDDATRQHVLIELTEVMADFLRRLPPGIGQARKELRALEATLTALAQTLDDLSPQALSIFCKELDGPRGEVSHFVKRIQTVAGRACMTAEEKPDKVRDVARNVLAGQVAMILNAHGLTAALTRDVDDAITGNRGGAAYARLLRCTLEAVGDKPPADLLQLMRSGIAVSNNPRGDLLS